MRILIFSISIILSVFLLLSCGTESTPIYTLSTSVVGEGTITPSTGTYEEGEVVTLSGTPSEHWGFNSWSGDGTGSTNTLSITMDSDKDVIGNFTERLYPLNITIIGEGTVEEEVVQSKTTDYPYKTVVQLTPIPSEDYLFVEWSGDISSTDDVVTVTVDEAVNVTATFRHYLEGRILQQVNGAIQEETNYPSPETNIFSTTRDYNTNENLTSYVSYDSDGSILFRDTYTYDSNHNLTEQIRYGSDDSVSFRVTFTYDSNNNLTEQIYYESDGSVSVRFTYSYDSNDNLTERILYNSSGSVSLRIIYSYDSSNNLTEQIYYLSDGSVLGRDTYTYDSNNNLIEQIYYESDGSEFGRDTFTYDSANNLIKWDFNSDTSNWTTEYEYDINGSLTKSYDVYNFLRSDSWYKTITTENRENIYYEWSGKIIKQNSSALNSKNHQLIWEFDKLNRNTNELKFRYRDIRERLDIDISFP